MEISDFLEDVAIIGFTKACSKHNINRTKIKELSFVVLDKDPTALTMFSTKQEVVYKYIAIKLKEVNL